MLRYQDVRNNERRLVGLTSLKSAEFDCLLSYFFPLCERYSCCYAYVGKPRKIPKFGSQSDEKLRESSDKLLFLLIYLKDNASQDFHVAYYDMSQGQVSNLVRVLTPLLDQALAAIANRSKSNFMTISVRFSVRMPLNVRSVEKWTMRLRKNGMP